MVTVSYTTKTPINLLKTSYSNLIAKLYRSSILKIQKICNCCKKRITLYIHHITLYIYHITLYNNI
ncbi:hypothetical protein HanPSC8_Chr01g0032641 [Helianthus annuus]|nr:hypothetical protein HanPSC8_Chr01g0032641 [Helianthus annuus]